MRFSLLRFALLLSATTWFVRAAEPAQDSAAAFEGTWLGRVVAPNGSTEIGFAFTKTEKGLLTRFHMPAMFVHNVPLGPATVEGDVVNFPPLNTALRRDGGRLVGTFGLSHLPVELARGGSFGSAPPRPEYPRGPEPRWTVALGAETWASPVVFDGTVYLGTVDGKMRAFDAASGRELWTWRGDRAIYGAALVTAKDLCFVDEADRLVCLERASGSLRWQTKLRDDRPQASPPNLNLAFNHRTPVPVLVDGSLYVGSVENGIHAIDPETGAIRWRDFADTKFFGTGGVTDQALWFGGYDGTVLALDRGARQKVTSTRLPGAVVSTPIVAGDTVVVGCRDYTLYGLRRDDLAVTWKFSFWFSWIESTPAVVDGLAYVGGSDFARVTALDPRNGTAKWSTVVHGLTWGTPLVTEHTVFAGTSAQRGAIIPHEGGLVALDRVTGAMKWRRAVPLAANASRAGYLGSLARAGDLAIGAAFDGTVSAFPIE